MLENPSSRRDPESHPGDNPAVPSPVSRASFVRRIGIATGVLMLGKFVFPLGDALSPLKAYAASTRAKATGRLLGNVNHVKPNQSLAYTDPRSGDPAVLIRLPSGRFVSYDAVCTHAGCTVPYDPTHKLLICPCHGARFDPARGAKVVGGPAPQPLTQLPIRIDASGNAYALDTKPGKGAVGGGLRQPPPPGSGREGDERDDAAGGKRHRRPKGGSDG